ncbi:hypothetical protein B8A46_01185 [Dolosigranulum pigrum]|uniref:hypothetical protein n=1 Tax=Dolosigranulum pigrum TaxID=29394 RepID=UPI000DBF9A56|nr:hypothetical protein [Dolosigranulum pigrum]RAN60837.1 hypothetical protein B8A46_01185 [Dolosigranulum pigrum]
MSSNQRDALLVIRRFAINIIKGNFDFADVSPKCKPYVVRCLDLNGFGRLVPEDYREYYEKTYGSKKNEKELEEEKEPETSEEPEATDSEETTEE